MYMAEYPTVLCRYVEIEIERADLKPEMEGRSVLRCF